MLHAAFMPSRLATGEPLRIAAAALALVACTAAAAAPAAAAEKPRAASINVCTDQLLLVLADPDQIVGLSPYARDTARSWAAGRARAFPRLSGEAEDVLVLKPALVLAGRFTKRATRELLKDKGLRVVEFDAARSLDDAKAQIRRAGQLLEQPARAAAEVARLDAAVARARAAAARRPYRVLPLSRRGWVPGGDGLISSLLAATGLTHAGRGPGLRNGSFASLEAIVSLRPDLILVAEADSFAEDQGRAFLLHPALQQLYPPERRIVVPERLTVCGGPMLAEALDRLTAEIERVSR